MFGNRLGWGVAAVLGVGVLALVFLVNSLATSISKPTTGAVAKGMDGKGIVLNLPNNPGMLDPIVLPFKASDWVPAMTEAGDAGPIYREAIAEYHNNSRLYGRDHMYGRDKKLVHTDPANLPAIQLLIKARTMTSAKIFRGEPESLMNYKPTAKDIKALDDLGFQANTIALHIKGEAGKENTARELAEAGFALGVRMAEERLRHEEWRVGVELLRQGALVLGTIDESRKGAAQALDAAMREMLTKRTIPLWYVIGSPDPSVIGRTAGDVFHIVKNSREPLWRIEGILKLGRYKLNAGGDPNDKSVPSAKAADQRQARAWVKRLMNDESEDKVIRAAAKAADAFDGGF